MSSSLRRTALVLGLAPVLLVAWGGSSAHAAIAGLERVIAGSPTNSTDTRSATASCPSGKQVTGAGAEIDSGGGQVILRRVRPDPGLTSVTVTAHEDETGNPDTWAVRAIAFCAPPPAGLERVSFTTASNSSNKGAVATCPAGKRVLGTGAELDGAGRQVFVNAITPASGLNSVTVFAVEDDDGATANWSVTGYAVCANPVAGRQRVVATSTTGSPVLQSAQADCPTGKQLTGLGGDIAGGGGDVILDELEPTTTALTSALVVAGEDEDGTTANWSVRAFAICADAAERVVTTPIVSDSNDKEATANCPAPKQVTGAGGDITSGGGQVRLDRIVPGSGLTGVTVFGFEGAPGFLGNWSVRAYAICAPPMPGLELVSATSAAGSPPSASVTTPPCPAGKSVVGVGADINTGSSQIFMTEVRPASNLSTGFALAFEDEDGLGASWSLTAYAICANTPPGLQEVIATSDPASDPAGVTATCPSGTTLLGTGAQIVDGQGQVVLDDLRPNALLTNVTVTGLEDENGFAGDWFLRSHAICANP
jgi:hypothetical protein